MSKIDEAAARWREHREASLAGKPDEGPYWEDGPLLDADAELLADAMLDRLAADERERQNVVRFVGTLAGLDDIETIEQARATYKHDVGMWLDKCLELEAELAKREAADESERELPREVRTEWMRHAGYQDGAETPQEVGALSVEVRELLAALRIERRQDEAERVEREKPIDEAWLLSLGFELSREGFPFHPEVDGHFKPSPPHITPTGKVYWDWKLEPPATDLLGVFETRGQLLDLLKALGV